VSPVLSDQTVSIVIPVFNKLAFTAQCLDRLDRHADGGPSFDVLIVDNASSDDTEAFFANPPAYRFPLRYVRNAVNEGFSRANNLGARQATSKYLLFLNNDTLATEGWLEAMVDIAERDPRVGVVGIKQVFPYTNRIHHTGIIFTADLRPQHIYPHADASSPHVNREREYQAVTGSCLLVPRDLFEACGGFDEAYRNGYEDIDLCLTVRRRGRTVVCCTSRCIHHYGQISETRTADDDRNAERLAVRWKGVLRADEQDFHRQDRRDLDRVADTTPSRAVRPATSHDEIYFADDLSVGSALSWVTTELVHALDRLGAPVTIREGDLSGSVSADRRRALTRLARPDPPVGGVQIRWSHYWPQHLGLDLHGRLNLELFVINYLFARPHAQPWDPWLQGLRQNGYRKLPLSTFSRDVLLQVGVPRADCAIIRPGYAPEIPDVDPPSRRDSGARLLTVTNSHDLERYGTLPLLDAYWSAFTRGDAVTLVVKDYGANSGDTTLRTRLRQHADRAKVEYVTAFTSKEKLIELYKSCDAFVSAHRGEGYGMKILDALACGLPVITPLFGGPTDFCTPANCLPVDFTLVPVGDCLDTRSLRITNGPVWADPDVRSLAARLREVVESPDEARRLGSQARADVVDRFTWEQAAADLMAFVGSQDEGTGVRRGITPPPARLTEQSPYWLGCRVSVIIPTCNRSQMLRTCLRALERQTILPQEFEVIVVDDGSTDDTRGVVEGQAWAFPIEYLHQANAGPGQARNLGLTRATGEFVLYIGDDILADPRLLESHLLAHATRPDAGTAILGHIDWAPHLERSAVMDFVCGPSTLQFAYAFIPQLPTLDFRFFYTSNISLKRQFLLDAAADGVTFDPCFTAAAFEDSEFALRLEARGLEIVYAPEARAFHDHWMDLDGFSRREFSAGRMAVVFYRKHPQIDDQLQVRWIGDWTDAVEDLLTQPELEARLRALDEQTNAFLRSLARTLEELVSLQQSLGTDLFSAKPGDASRSRLLDAVFAVIFDVERTRGKVHEWYAGVDDPRKVDLAMRLLGCVRRLEFLSSTPDEVRRLRGTVTWLETDVAGGLRDRITILERHLAGSPADLADLQHGGDTSANAFGRLDTRLTSLERHLAHANGHRSSSRLMIRFLRRADLSIQYRLGRHVSPRLLVPYQSVRRRLKRFLPRPPASSR
jgi:GT2 family glycosyltransferase/glycosyltransferase involved in cell wall biosynthesis